MGNNAIFHTTLYTQALHRPASHTAPNEKPSTSKDSKENEVSCCRPTTEEHLMSTFPFQSPIEIIPIPNIGQDMKRVS